MFSADVTTVDKGPVHRNHFCEPLCSSKMKIFTILMLICFVFCVKWTAIISLDRLEEECSEPTTLDKVVRGVRSLLGFPNPEPPWWKPLVCGWTNPEPQGYVEALVMVPAIFLLLRVATKRTKLTIGRLSRGRRLKAVPKRTSQQAQRARIKLSPHLPLPVNANKDDTIFRNGCLQSFGHFDGKIHIEHGTPRGQERYREILIGPIATTFTAIRCVLATYFKMMNIPDSRLKWTFSTKTCGTPEFLGVCSERVRFAVVLIPDEGINVQVQRLGPANGHVREVTYQTYHVTYKGFVLRDEGKTVLQDSM